MTVLCQDIGDGWCVRTSVTFRGVLRGRPPRVARVAGSWWETYLVPGCGHGYWVRPWSEWFFSDSGDPVFWWRDRMGLCRE